MSAAYDVAYYIANTLAQGNLGVNLFVNGQYDTPDSQISVFEYGGRPTDLGMGSPPNTDALEWSSVQVLVRALNPSWANSTIYSIYKSMDGLGSVTINSVNYLFFRALQPPFVLERDEQKRVTMAFNMDVQKRRS